MIGLRFFGERWDSPVFLYAEEDDVPVGSECFACHEVIGWDDSGTWVDRDGDEPVHIECFLRMFLGGPNHLLGLCSCHGGDQPPDPPHMTNREAALMVKTIVEIQRVDTCTGTLDDG